MFPKGAAVVPQIRFKGFSKPWSKVSWRNVVDISTQMVNPRSGHFDDLAHIGPGNIESFTGRLLQNVLSVKESNLISGKFYFKKGDIIYSKIRPLLAKYVIAPYDGLASADAYVLNTKNGIEQIFLFTILQTKKFYDYSVSVSARTGMPKINRDELNLYDFLAPDPDEQCNIGIYFNKLDSIIHLQSQEIEKLKCIKKAMLEKMFV